MEELEGWIALPEVAKQLGISRQAMHGRVNGGNVPADLVREVRIGGGRKLVLISEQYIRQQEVANA